ncbi:glycosyltransferase family 9 protein [Candidatus Woesearchaeota archaeon]|jgi:lipopolysaccharide heptosyltransferase II|nr:glycosyltransferase family 9 protein [Candidatus Woesearchaeota archaeon]MBT4322116.1 glycosyltransferase family 9 protein [Candidatus Woesearchaeota archaeon]MBT4630693.1 glycosyltransferase family 9 protein [Candidatus Woesearchaeota archaeon]
MKILFFKMGAIGDVLMTTPLVKQTRKAFPKAKIHYLVGESSSQILKNNKNIDKIIKFNERIITNKRILRWLKLTRNIKKQNYDLIFVLDKHKIFNLTAKLTSIKTRIGFNRLKKDGIFLTKKVDYFQNKHDILAYLELLNKINPVDYKDTKMGVFPTEEDKVFANKFWKDNKLKSKKVLVICPGGGQNIGQRLSLKVWPTENYIELIKKLRLKYKIILLGGETDKKIEKKILSKIKVLSLIGNTTLHETAEIMRKANIVLTNDSGPMHIASAVNNKIISLFGPTNPKVLAPLNKGSKYYWKLKRPTYDIYGNITNKRINPIKSITVKEVIKSIK